ncbi:unnamed protein product [marine sediment metagenome]|uniref:Uncharacterized protein n=1 Tax=marine sediment metagenome TaxID=412755 RepID=X1DTQ0_9ZZZZ
MIFEEYFKIRCEILGKYKKGYGKIPSKPQFILEVLDYLGSVSLRNLVRITSLKQPQLENWVFKLNANRKLTIDTNNDNISDWIIKKIKN